MRIGIDARLIEETGVGRYIRNLIGELATLDQANEYVIFLRKKAFVEFRRPNSRWEKVLADVPWHSVTEQLVMPRIFQKAKLDLLHIPYFNVPIFYFGRMVVTIHDLTILHLDTGRASSLPWVLYKLRRLGYGFILRIGLLRAQKIIAVSETTKADIVKNLGIDANKIMVTYEGVNIKPTNEKRLIKEEYFLYVGNAYPHKNLEILLRAVGESGKKLVLVGKDDYFYRRLPRPESVIFFGAASDVQLANLYQNAKALVFPSLMEGFGLPAIEALSLGCPVICSDIPIFHEILGDNAIFFNPHDSKDLAMKLRREISKKIVVLDARFNWNSMSKQTLHIYESSIRL